MAKSEKEESFLKLALKRFERASTAEKDNRRMSVEDQKMLAGDQWPEEIKKQREDESRPCLTINRLPSFKRQITGDMRLNKTRIKIRPVDDDGDPEIARIRGAIIKHVENQSKAESVYDWSGDMAVSCGMGYMRILHDYADDMSFDQEIYIKRVKNPHTVYGDPDFTEPDGSDRDWYFITELVDKEEFKKRYPKAAEITEFPDGSDGENRERWYTEDGKVRIAEYWYREKAKKTLALLEDGRTVILEDEPDIDQAAIKKTRKMLTHSVYQCIISGNQRLTEPKKFPATVIPVIPVFGDEILVDGETIYKSAIRDALDPQRMFNFWRTASAELIALAPKAPWVGTVKQFENHPEWDDANTRSYSKLTYTPDQNAPAPQRQPFAGVPAGVMAEATACVDDMKSTTGIYDASLGAQSNETSGVAIQKRQAEGDVSNFVFIDNLSRAIAYAGRVINEMIPYIYDNARIFRITNEDGSKETLPINQFVTRMEGSETGKYSYEPASEGMEGASFLDISQGRYDVIVETGPAYSTQRAEKADAMTSLMQSLGGEGAIIAPEVISAQDFPNATDIATVFKNYLVKKGAREDDQKDPMMQEEPDPAMLMAQQQAQAEAEAKQAELALKSRELDIKQMEVEVKSQEVILKRQESMMNSEENIRRIVQETLAGMVGMGM